MVRGGGVHRISAENMRMITDKVVNAQDHNEREKESYVNQGIVPISPLRINNYGEWAFAHSSILIDSQKSLCKFYH